MHTFFIEIFKSLYILSRYRAKLFQGVFQDIRQRYVGSAGGLAWTLIFPALQLGIYTVVYVFIFRIRPPGLTELGYVLLVFSGLVPLLAFNDALMAANSSLISQSSLLLNTVFPADLIPIRAALAAQCPSLCGMGMTILLGIFLGKVSFTYLLIPLFWIFLLMFVVGLGLFLSLLTLVIKDIQYAIGLVLMLLLILSPFSYTPAMVPSSLKFFLLINPLSYFVLSFQSLICYGKLPEWYLILAVVSLSFGSFLGGLFFFRRVKNLFFDYV